MRLRLVVLFGAVLAIGAAAPATAQEPRLVGLVPEPARTQVDGILNAARAERLPVEPLVDRALEGAAKGARAELIVAAVARLREELRIVRQSFGEGASAAELMAGASALRAGAKPADLAKLRKLRPRQPITVAAGVLAELVAAGVAADTGIAAVLALASNAGDADYIAFRRNVERDIAQGASPAASVGVRLRAMGDMAAEAPRDLTSSGSNSTTPPRKIKP